MVSCVKILNSKVLTQLWVQMKDGLTLPKWNKLTTNPEGFRLGRKEALTLSYCMRAAGGSVEHLSSGSGELRDQSSNLPENSQIKAWKVFSFQSFSGDFCCEAEATVSFVGGCGKKGGWGVSEHTEQKGETWLKIPKLKLVWGSCTFRGVGGDSVHS